MQRVVATRMFAPKERGAAEYAWKMGETKKWTVWFNANNKYRAESAVMDLKLVDGDRVVDWYHMGGIFTTLGVIIIGGLILVLAIKWIVICCVFCKCCAACRKCTCCKGLMEKCKRSPKGEAEGD